jgi:hypothetical protein
LRVGLHDFLEPETASGDLSHGLDEARQGRVDISANPFAMTSTNGSRSFDALDPFEEAAIEP